MTEQHENFYLKNGYNKYHGNFRIISGEIHYFRIPSDSWQSSIQKLKILGANTVTTAIPWNLHMPFYIQNFENLDFSDENNLNLFNFLEIAAQHEMYVILKIGPYINAHMEFGGLPAWLLSDPDMQVRTNSENYQKHVENYFNLLLPKLKPYLWSENQKTGPIFMIQIENDSTDLPHLRWLNQMVTQNHKIQEKIVFSIDSEHAQPMDVNQNLMSVSTDVISMDLMNAVDRIQPNRPMLISNYNVGYHNHWADTKKSTKSIQSIQEDVQRFLDFNPGTSINFYMFHGGSNFQYINGADAVLNPTDEYMTKDLPFYYKNDITSYDYDGILTENGDITEKFDILQKILDEKLGTQNAEIQPPSSPEITIYKNNPKFEKIISFERLFSEFVNDTLKSKSETLQFVENLKIHESESGFYSGQTNGYTIYETEVILDANATSFTLSNLHNLEIHDAAFGSLIDMQADPTTRDFYEFFYYHSNYGFPDDTMTANLPENMQVNHGIKKFKFFLTTINQGRVSNDVNNLEILNFQRKGVIGDLYLNDQILSDWTIIPLEFDQNFINRISNNQVKSDNFDIYSLQTALHVYSFEVEEDEEIMNTFLSYHAFHEGMMFINGYNLGKFSYAGPVLGYLVPGKYIQKGTNYITVWEEMYGMSGFELKFVDHMPYGSFPYHLH